MSDVIERAVDEVLRLGRMGGPLAAGPGGACVCPECGERVSHDRATPCYRMTCPECGARMTREETRGRRLRRLRRPREEE